jgi:hypothetical protein
VDRVVLWAALVGAGALIAVGAAFVLRDYTSPVFLNGGETATRIDSEVGDAIAARFPGVVVGTARCPIVLNLTAKRAGRCVLPVGDSELRIGVALSDDPVGYPAGYPELRDVDALFVARDAERAVGAQLAERYGEPFAVRCPGPGVRVIADDAPVTCSVEAPDVPRRGIEVRVSGVHGDVQAETLPSIATRAARTFGSDIAGRTAGSVAVSGHAMERFVRETAAAEVHGQVGRLGLVGAAHCPPRIVLREGGSTKCTLWAGGLPLRYDVHFEKGPGLFVSADQTIEPLAWLREIATRYFERPTYTHGKPLQAHVDCGAAKVAFVEPGSSVRCKAKVGDDDASFAFQIDDPQGGFRIVED